VAAQGHSREARPAPLSAPSCRRSAPCCPLTVSHRLYKRPSAGRRRRAGAARARAGSGRTSAGWPTPRGRTPNSRNRHGLDRARCRGTSLFHVQLLLGCTALNMKRLATHAGEAAEGQAAVSLAGQARTLRVASAASTRQQGMRWRSVTLPSYSGHRDQLITVPLWSVSVSLN